MSVQPQSSKMYLAFGESGEYWRPAQVVGELPHHLTRDALDRIQRSLSQLLDLEPISNLKFGLLVHRAYSLTPTQIKNHPHANLLLKRGDDLPLSLIKEHD